MMMTELVEGSVITFSSENFNKIFLGFKCKQSPLTPYCTTLVTIKNWFLINSELQVIPVCHATEYLADDINFNQKINLMNLKNSEVNLVKNILPGKIIKLSNSLAIVTKNVNYSGVVCFFLGDPVNVPNESLYHYLGTCDTYNGMLNYSKSLRVCPNCNSLALQEIKDETPGFNSTSKCLVCDNIVAISWRRD